MPRVNKKDPIKREMDEMEKKVRKKIYSKLREWRKYIDIFRGRKGVYNYIILRELAEKVSGIDDIIESFMDMIELKRFRLFYRERYWDIFYHRIVDLVKKGYISRCIKGYCSITLKGIVAIGLVDDYLPNDIYIDLYDVERMLQDGIIRNLDNISNDELERLMWRWI